MKAKPKLGFTRKGLLLGVLLSVFVMGQTPNAPIVNFKLPLFNDAGYRTGYLRGGQGIYQNEVDIRILEMELNQYSGDERDEVIGLIESPEALFRYDKSGRSSASGPGSILIENDMFELTGEDWNWQEQNNQVAINRNVRIVIAAEIGDLIK